MNLRSTRKIFLRSPATFRPMVRWLWNDQFDPDRLSTQMDQLLDMGMGGALLRPGAGLPAGAYLSESWFDAVTAVARRARKRRASLWIAEDFGDPATRSVVASILRDEPTHAAQMLELEDLAPGVAAKPLKDKEAIIATFEVARESNTKNRHPFELQMAHGNSGSQSARRLVFRSVISPDRLRIFESSATLELLRRTHQHYHTHARKYFGNTIGLCLMLGVGLPNAQGMVPWDSELSALFEETHGYSLTPNLPALFFDIRGCESVRSDFWSLVDDMFREGFDEPFARWCSERGMPHACAASEPGNLERAVANGGRAMLRHATHSFVSLNTRERELNDAHDRIALIEARSIKRQAGIEGVVEIAAAGATAMKRLCNGVNFLAGRTALSSLRGNRKVNAGEIVIPADSDNHMRAVTDAESRLGWMLGQGHRVAQTLIVHPYLSLQAAHRAGNSDDAETSALHDSIVRHFEGLTRVLTEASIEFDFADEAVLAKHGTADQRILRVGAAEYRAVVLPPLLNLRSSTLELLHDLAIGGGLVIAVGSLAELVDGRGSDRVLRFFAEYGERVIQGVDFGRYHAVVDRLRRAALHTPLNTKKSPDNTDRIVFQRRIWEDAEMVGLHNWSDPATTSLQYSAAVTGRAESWDLVTGAPRVLCKTTAGEPLALSVPLDTDATALIVTTPEPSDDERFLGPMVEESRMIPAWSVRRVDPNIAVLRECRIAESGALADWLSPEDARRLLAERLAQARGPVSLRTHWRFRVKAGSATISSCRAAAEFNEGASLSLDGAELLATDDKWPVDPSIRLTDLPPLSAGEHMLEIWRLYSVAGDFQPPWIQGAFANVLGLVEGACIEATREALSHATLSTQGLDAYFGTISYSARVDGFSPGDEKRIEVRLPGLTGAAEIRVDGSRAGFAIAPDVRCDLTDTWRTGVRTVEIVFRIPPGGLLAALQGVRTNGSARELPQMPPELVVLGRRG